METLAPIGSGFATCIRITTGQPTEFIDITTQIQAVVAVSGIRWGFVNVQSLHTTAAVVLNEHEPLLLSDFAAVLEEAAPSDRPYRHDDLGIRTVNVTADERVNGHAHCRALLLGPSVCLNVVDGELQLGRWQRLFLAELDGPRQRQLSVLAVGSGR
jgi:secondary thiamine-phosphate synthase enzyme